jgi:dipeptidase D
MDSISFKPQILCDYFMGITQRSHPSANQPGITGNEDPVRKYVVEEAQQIPGVKVAFYQPDATEPGDRVIVLSRLGSGQYANKKPVILQAHMDMVFNPVDMEFPLNVIKDTSHTDGTWIKAKDKRQINCTLGADDGIGVATALAILKDDSLKDIPMECLFTVQEETDMGGAQNCKLKYLTGEILLNLDAEDLKTIIYGSAGGAETRYSKTLSRMNMPSGFQSIKVAAIGMRGGHSGVDINKGRMNAIKALAQALERLNKRINNLDVPGSIASYDMYLVDVKRTDIIKANAIPASAEAIVVVPNEQAESFINDINIYGKALGEQNLPVEGGFKLSAASVQNAAQPLDSKSTDAVLCILAEIPAGVIAMMPAVPDVVETSSNLYDIAIAGDKVTIQSSNRSSSDRALAALNTIQTSIGAVFNFDVITGIDSYPSWQPDENSPILNIARTVYSSYYRDNVKTTVIHAGLECGTLATRFTKEKGVKLDCVSIGPTIKNPHTGNETLQIESEIKEPTVNQFYECVAQIIKKLYA